MPPTTNEQPMVIDLPEEKDIVPDSSESASDKSDVNWDEYSGVKDSGENVEEVEGDLEILDAPDKPQTEEPDSAPAEKPAPAEPDPLPSSTPVEAPAAPAAPAPMPTPEAPTPPPSIPSTAPFDAAAWESEQVSKLETMYAVSGDDAEKLQTEPELVLPKMAARMHLDITKSLLTAVQSMIPEILTHQQSAQAADQEARTEFYSANPDLNDPKYEQAVLQVAKMYRAANPSAPRAEAVKTIGNMARMALGLSQQPIDPAPTASAALLQPARPKPFSPARGGGAAAPNKPPSIWDEMSRDD